MSAKFPRRSFAAPLVVTLAVPACIVTSGKPQPPPTSGTGGGGSVRDHRTEEQPHANPPGPHVNPPRPTDTSAQPTEPPPGTQPGNDTMQQQTPTQQAPLRTWTVMLQGKSCVAQYDVTCPPKSTCNPPPPTTLARCPDGITVERPYKIREEAANSCALYYPMPDCPAGVACNPPRPQKIDCPTR